MKQASASRLNTRGWASAALAKMGDSTHRLTPVSHKSLKDRSCLTWSSCRIGANRSGERGLRHEERIWSLFDNCNVLFVKFGTQLKGGLGSAALC